MPKPMGTEASNRRRRLRNLTANRTMRPPSDHRTPRWAGSQLRRFAGHRREQRLGGARIERRSRRCRHQKQVPTILREELSVGGMHVSCLLGQASHEVGVEVERVQEQVALRDQRLE